MSLTGSLAPPINEYSWQLILKLCGLFDSIMVIRFYTGNNWRGVTSISTGGPKHGRPVDSGDERRAALFGP